MKKNFFILTVLLSAFIFWCDNQIQNNTDILETDLLEKDWLETEQDTNIWNSDDDNTLDFITNTLSNLYPYEPDSKIFVNYAILWTWLNKNWNTEYYLVSDFQWYYIDERWNLSDSWWARDLPISLEISEDAPNSLLQYKQAEDWSNYLPSIKSMFSKQAFDKWKSGKYKYIYDKTLLQQAEEYFWVNIIPEQNNNFECKFCDKIRYLDDTNDEEIRNNELKFNYTSSQNWNKTIYFWLDWKFETKWSQDEWTWVWYFWNNENTVIIHNQRIAHVYDRYIITDLTENSMKTILEIIQNS